jgi:hypothetical protein
MGVPGIWDNSISVSNPDPTTQFQVWLKKHSSGCGLGVVDFGYRTCPSGCTPNTGSIPSGKPSKCDPTAAGAARCCYDRTAQCYEPINTNNLQPYNAIIMLDTFHSAQDRADCIKNLSNCKGKQNYTNYRGQSTNYMQGHARVLSDDEILTIQQWIRNGGGISTVASFFYDAPEANNINNILAAFNVKYATQSGGNVVTALNNGTTGVDVSTFDHLSPPMSFLKPVSLLQVNSGVPIEAMVGSPTPTLYAWAVDPGDGQTKNIGYYVQTAATNGKRGRINVWTDEWITYDQVWTALAKGGYKYQPDVYWENVVNWLGQCK